MRLVLGASGSIAVLSLPSYISYLQNAGFSEITVVMTKTAESFLPASSVEYLVDRVYTDDDWGPGHVAVAEMGDRFVMLPTTANLLFQAAHGAASNLLTTMLLAVERPVVFVPNMHRIMWEQPSVQRNVEQLRKDGHVVLDMKPGHVYETSHKRVESGLVMASMDEVVRAIYGS